MFICTPRLVQPVQSGIRHLLETSFAQSATAGLAMMEQTTNHHLILAPSTSIAGCVGVYPTKDFKKGDVACHVESRTGHWGQDLSNACSFDLLLQCPDPRNILKGQWEVFFQGEPDRYLWPNINSTSNYDGVHGLTPNVQLKVVGPELGNNFMIVEFTEDCLAFSRELLLSYPVKDERPTTVYLGANQPKLDKGLKSDAQESGPLADSPPMAPVTGPPGQPTPTSEASEPKPSPAALVDLDNKPSAPPPQVTSGPHDDVVSKGQKISGFEKPPGSALYWYHGAMYITLAKAVSAFPASLLYTVVGGETLPTTSTEALVPYVMKPTTVVW
jgi:hypothetical protein